MRTSLRVRLVQMQVLPGRPLENTERILRAIAAARDARVDLAVFPEMAVPGYLIGDEWEREAFLRDCERAGEAIREAADGLAVIFGNIGLDWSRRNEDGRVRKYNACFAAEDRRFIRSEATGYDFAIKTLMPNYREFDDSRHFYDLSKLAAERGTDVRRLLLPLRVCGVPIGCILCEDAWDSDYGLSPVEALVGHGARLIVNVSCSPFTWNKNHKRNRVFGQLADRYGIPLLYVNNVGIQNNGKTVFTFDGASCVYDGHGGQVNSPESFEEGVLDQVVPLAGGTRFGQPVNLREDDIALLWRAMRYGTAEFARACGVRRVVVGVSGGIDSAVVAALYRRILEPEDLLLVNMPSRFNSPTTKDLARELAGNLGCPYAEIPIEESVRQTAAQLREVEFAIPGGMRTRRLEVSPFTLENIQARDRSSRILAGVAAAFGGAFTCNANKSEMTVGYTTLYGDLGGYLANLADLWKGEVYAVGRHLNEEVYETAVIPEGIFTVTPSAELSPDQDVDRGKGDPLVYPYHDCLFRSWIERWNRVTPEENLEWYLDSRIESELGYSGRVRDLFPRAADFVADLERWWGQYQGMGVAKRIQAPPVLAVKRRAFGFDHRESQTGARYTARYEELRRRALAE